MRSDFAPATSGPADMSCSDAVMISCKVGLSAGTWSRVFWSVSQSKPACLIQARSGQGRVAVARGPESESLAMGHLPLQTKTEHRLLQEHVSAGSAPNFFVSRDAGRARYLLLLVLVLVGPSASAACIRSDLRRRDVGKAGDGTGLEDLEAAQNTRQRSTHLLRGAGQALNHKQTAADWVRQRNPEAEAYASTSVTKGSEGVVVHVSAGGRTGAILALLAASDDMASRAQSRDGGRSYLMTSQNHCIELV